MADWSKSFFTSQKQSYDPIKVYPEKIKFQEMVKDFDGNIDGFFSKVNKDQPYEVRNIQPINPSGSKATLTVCDAQGDKGYDIVVNHLENGTKQLIFLKPETEKPELNMQSNKVLYSNFIKPVFSSENTAQQNQQELNFYAPS